MSANSLTASIELRELTRDRVLARRERTLTRRNARRTKYAVRPFNAEALMVALNAERTSQ